MHKILLVMAELFEYPLEAASREQGTERNTNIEAMRAKLHETLAANPWASQPRNDPFCFAFVVLPVSPDGGVEPARGQVKIDTGAEDNWISTRLLEMASVPFTPDASLGTFRGANGQPFKPLGRVSVTWYSENQARTQTSDFLIHDSAPFDAILGSGWVLEECLNVFNKPVLPLFRMTMGPGTFEDSDHLLGTPSDPGSRRVQRPQEEAGGHERQQRRSDRSPEDRETGTARERKAGRGAEQGPLPYHVASNVDPTEQLVEPVDFSKLRHQQVDCWVFNACDSSTRKRDSGDRAASAGR